MQNHCKCSFFFILIIISSLVAGCSSDEVKKSENSGRIYALYDSLDRIKKNYETKNLTDFFADYASSYPHLDDKKKQTGEIFKQFNLIKIQFYLDHVVFDKNSSSLFVRWEGEWSHAAEEAIKAEGNSILKFSVESAPHLIEIQGIDPFTAPVKDKQS
ncbi:MAG: hypothetical protein ACHQYP_06785 [Nitrospiria bacterium]